MELDTHAATRRASQTSSACQRVFLTAELATLIFLHLDEPAAFNATCRLFHGVASSKYAVYSWLNKRYWKCEQLYELLARPGLRKAEYVDVGRDLLLAEAKLTIGHVTLILQFLLDEKAVPCSRQLICHLVAHSNCCFLYYHDPASRGCEVPKTLLDGICARYAEYKNVNGTYSSDDSTDIARAIFRLEMHGPLVQSSLNSIIRGSPDHKFIMAHFDRYGLPAYDSVGLTTLLVAILLVGHDFEWWESTLRCFAGFNQLVPENLVDAVLNGLINPKRIRVSHFLVPLQTSYLDTALEPVPGVSIRLLERTCGISFWKHICRVPYGTLRVAMVGEPTYPFRLHATVPWHHHLGRLQATLLLLENPNTTFDYFIAYFLLFTAHTSSEPRSYRSEAFRHLYMQCLRDKFSHLSEAIKTRLSSLLLVAVACAGNAWGKPNHVKSSLQLLQCWSLDAVSLALADPTLTALEIPRVHAYIADRAPKTIDLTASMESAARLLLQSNATGPHLLDYSRMLPWLSGILETLVCQEGVSGIFEPYEVAVNYSDAMQVGVYKAAQEEEIKYRGREGSTPVDLLTSVALLSILDKRRSMALKIILREAARLGEHKIVKLYEENGISLN